MSGASGLPRGFALRGPLRCAPRCRARTGLCRRRGLPVADHAAVGGFGAARELALGLADGGALVAGDPADARARRGAGGQLELAELRTGQRWALERVVLFAPEQAPERGGAPARGRGRGDLRALAGADALEEGAQRTGGLGDRPGRFAEHVAGEAGAGLGDVAVAGAGVARLPHARIEPELADRMACGREAPDVADRGDERRGGVDVDAGDGHQPPDLG